MRILQICPKPPRPAIDGGCIAIDNITKGLLKQGHSVKVLSICTHKHPYVESAISAEYKAATDIESIFVDTKLNFVDAFSNLITRDSYNISRFFSADFDMKLAKVLKAEPFDVIHIESLFMTPYISTIRRCTDAKIILRSHNLEFKIWTRMALVSANPPRRAYLKLLAHRLKQYELKIINQVDGLAAISVEDAGNYSKLGCRVPIITIPFGLDLIEYQTDNHYTFNPKLFHLGAMDWMPNIEGVNWFLKEAWGEILQDFPDLRLHLAGKSSENFKMKGELRNVTVDGQIPESKTYMRDHGPMIVPLLSGGGMRIKIIEGMALGKVIISTTIGAEGINVTDGKNILIADTPKQFREKITLLHENPSLGERISLEARKFIEAEYDYAVLAGNLANFYSQLRAQNINIHS